MTTTAPTVAVASPVLDGRVMVDLLTLSCSECGDLSDCESAHKRSRLQYRAWQHAQSVHDGLVDREGWT